MEGTEGRGKGNGVVGNKRGVSRQGRNMGIFNYLLNKRNPV